jgi:hypothetical protein
MRVVLIHDTAGTIKALAATLPNGPQTGKAPKPGEQMTVLDMPETSLNPGPDEIMSRLSDIAANHKVDVPSVTARLARK